MENLEQPKINVEDIQKRANEAAEKAYLQEIEKYYTDYDSPYKKLIRQQLNKQGFSYPLYMPEIMQVLNKAIIQETDKIANNAVAMTFLPMLTYAFTNMEKSPKMSDILKEIIYEVDPDPDDYESFYFSYEKVERYDWLKCELTTPNNHYEFTLHLVSESKKDDKQRYHLLSFPYNKYKSGYNSNMKIRKDDIEIEMPFTPDVLQDKVLTVFFKIMLSKCEITIDCTDFDDSMFPDRECYC